MTRHNGTPSILHLDACLTRPVARLLEERLGRPVRGRLIEQDVISRIRPPGLGRLHTEGPVTHRHVILEDSQPPHLPVAASWALFVAERLPGAVLHDLDGSGEPFDRLLTLHGLSWHAELSGDDGVAANLVTEASLGFAWATSTTPLVEVTRIITVQAGPVAVIIDEVPLLPQLGAATPLLALTG